MRRLAAVTASVVLVLCASAPVAGAAVEPLDPIPTANDQVNSIVRAGDVLWIGGDFTEVAVRTGPAALLSAAGGERRADFPVFGAGTVEAAIADGAGGWYVGGEFERAGGLPRRNLVHVLADGTVDPAFAPDPDAKVKALALRDGVLYAAGDFTAAGGAERRVVAALDARTGAATAFDAGLTSDFIGGRALEVSAERVYLGGNFTLPGGDSARLAAFDRGTGAHDEKFAPEVSDLVSALDLAGSRLYVGSLIFFEGGPPLQVLDAEDGTADRDFATEIDGTVEDIEVAGDTVYAAGSFGAPRTGVAAMNAASGATRPFDAGLGGSANVSTLALEGSELLLGGIFSFGEEDALHYLASVDPGTGARRSGPADEPNGTVKAIVTQGDDLLAGGEFTAAGGERRDRLAAISAVDGSLLPAAPGANGGVASLVTDGERVYAGGDFTTLGGQPHGRLAAFDAKTGAVDEDFVPSTDDFVAQVLLDGSRLLVAGGFKELSGQPRRGLAAVDLEGQLLPFRADAAAGADSDDPDANDNVLDIALVGRRLYAAGSFAEIGGEPRPGAAALNADTGGVDPKFQPPAFQFGNFGGLYALAATPDRVYVGGSFRGTPESLAALDARTGELDEGFDARLDREFVYALETAGSSLYVGGSFDDIGGGTRTGFAELDQATGDVRGPDLGLDRFVFTIGLEPGAILVGGDFSAAGGEAQQGFATFTTPPASASPPVVEGAAEAGRVVRCAPGAWTGAQAFYAYAWLRDGAPIADAVGAEYRVTDADVGRRLSCRVTARNLGGSATADSATVTPTGPPPPTDPPTGPASDPPTGPPAGPTAPPPLLIPGPPPGTGPGGPQPPPIALERRTGELSAKVKSRKKGRGATFTVSGTLKLPVGVRKADGCAGRVTIRIKAGKRTISNRRGQLSKDCRYKKTVTISNPRRFGDAGKVRVFAVFEGNKVLKPKQARRRTAKVRVKPAG